MKTKIFESSDTNVKNMDDDTITALAREYAEEYTKRNTRMRLSSFVIE